MHHACVHIYLLREGQRFSYRYKTDFSRRVLNVTGPNSTRRLIQMLIMNMGCAKLYPIPATDLGKTWIFSL